MNGAPDFLGSLVSDSPSESEVDGSADITSAVSAVSTGNEASSDTSSERDSGVSSDMLLLREGLKIRSFFRSNSLEEGSKEIRLITN